ncbi:MAG: bifunctional UDP-3-O-[3-hydroxymyristoyl] N-acetylglucosamine deacetylase/3-hydroxyacyl-ACP dehydratase [Prevotellaceae bacterium]|jgi:UDP-3-O-[3-hydroxymyristoyl] N-acetylglucosamine deacetylase/3-hydroxyacyl-[acyl-carrier-protein] dehydratase|nr:bifunctional UDP-3-O-[3-hydroxymyristoyl] N-acetylglucosamine deacetylase/3-hydroxyacyl-ACP dehydratase [Prevotellaceae bacterium]
MLHQRTIKNPFKLTGKGLHTGLDIELCFVPAPENHGIIIKRVDLPGQPEMQAVAEFVTQTTRGTVLKKEGDVQVSTIEHAMSALYAFGIDNCLLEVNAPEFPILDGSAKYFVEEIEKAGIEEQNEEKDVFVIRKKMEFALPETGAKITILPDDTFSIDVHIGYNSRILNNQFAILDDLSDFAKNIAHCRTFVFVREIEPLLKMNLIKGGDWENAVVIYDELMSQENLDHLADLMHQPHRSAETLGYLNKKLFFDNEPARHKLLDVIGDLSLCGKQIQGKVIAHCPGHEVNTGMAKLLRKEIRKNTIQPPVYDENKRPVMDINAIRNHLPHRWPFLLVDKIIEKRRKSIVGIKNVTANESFFVGHFPEEPVMPGVLLIEAMAQTGGLLVLSQIEDAKSYSTYFLKIDNVKFRHKVVPGDTLIFHLEMLDEIRRGCAPMKGHVFVGQQLVAEAEFLAQIVKNK